MFTGDQRSTPYPTPKDEKEWSSTKMMTFQDKGAAKYLRAMIRQNIIMGVCTYIGMAIPFAGLIWFYNFRLKRLWDTYESPYQDPPSNEALDQLEAEEKLARLKKRRELLGGDSTSKSCVLRNSPNDWGFGNVKLPSKPTS